jgi:indolepyruvate ferredoxin oxidoreductase
VEQELPGEYLSAIDLVVKALSADNLPEAISLAELPDVVRGYEDIKLANVEIYRSSLAEGLTKFR